MLSLFQPHVLTMSRMLGALRIAELSIECPFSAPGSLSALMVNLALILFTASIISLAEFSYNIVTTHIVLVTCFLDVSVSTNILFEYFFKVVY